MGKVFILRILCIFVLCIYCYCYVSKISYDFVLKWPVREEDFKPRDQFRSSGRRLYTSENNNGCLRKTTFQFSDVENLTFSLCLLEDRTYNYYYIILESGDLSKFNNSIQLEYAYIATPHQIYSLHSSNLYHFNANKLTSSILGSERGGLFSNGNTTIYCKIHVKALVASSFLSQDNLRLESYIQLNSSGIFKLCSHQKKLRQKYENTFERCVGRSYIDDFALSGKIPNFNVTIAKDLLSIAPYIERWKISELTALSIGYLMDHLTCENVSSILQMAAQKEIPILKKKCINFIADQCEIHKRTKF